MLLQAQGLRYLAKVSTSKQSPGLINPTWLGWAFEADTNGVMQFDDPNASQ